MKKFAMMTLVAALFTAFAMPALAAAPKKGAAKAADKKEAAKGGAKLELNAGGVTGVTIDAPAGATVKEGAAGGVEITAGDKFQLQVVASKADIAGWKKDIAANDVNKLKKYHVDTADELLYESAVMGPEFHMVANVKVGDAAYSCEDVKGPTFTKADAEAMLKACHSLAKK
jgi:hypothetical protein